MPSNAIEAGSGTVVTGSANVYTTVTVPPTFVDTVVEPFPPPPLVTKVVAVVAENETGPGPKADSGVPATVADAFAPVTGPKLADEPDAKLFTVAVGENVTVRFGVVPGPEIVNPEVTLTVKLSVFGLLFFTEPLEIAWPLTDICTL